MFCPHCGRQLSQAARFCPSCGHSLNERDLVPNRPLVAYAIADGVLIALYLLMPWVSFTYYIDTIDLSILSFFGFLSKLLQYASSLVSFSSSSTEVVLGWTIGFILLFLFLVVLPVVRLGLDMRSDLRGEPTNGSGACTVGIIGLLIALLVIIAGESLSSALGMLTGMGSSVSIAYVPLGWWLTIVFAVAFLFWRHSHGRRVK